MDGLEISFHKVGGKSVSENNEGPPESPERWFRIADAFADSGFLPEAHESIFSLRAPFFEGGGAHIPNLDLVSCHTVTVGHET